MYFCYFFFFQAEDGIRDYKVTGVQTCALPIYSLKPGAKYFEWEAKGVPLRLEIGPRDVAAGQAMAARRAGGKGPVKLDGLARTVADALEEIQTGLFKAARERREAHSVRGVTKQQFLEFMKGAGGFAYAGYCGSEPVGGGVKQQTG